MARTNRVGISAVPWRQGTVAGLAGRHHYHESSIKTCPFKIMLTSLKSFAGIKGQVLFLSSLLCNLIQLDSYISLLSLTALELTLNFRMVHRNGVFLVFIGARGVRPTVEVGRVPAMLIKPGVNRSWSPGKLAIAPY